MQLFDVLALLRSQLALQLRRLAAAEHRAELPVSESQRPTFMKYMQRSFTNTCFTRCVLLLSSLLQSMKSLIRRCECCQIDCVTRQSHLYATRHAQLPTDEQKRRPGNALLILHLVRSQILPLKRLLSLTFSLSSPISSASFSITFIACSVSMSKLLSSNGRRCH